MGRACPVTKITLRALPLPLPLGIKPSFMLNRLTTGWNFRRILYVAMGALIVSQAIADKQWFGVFFGAYFASMGLFAFGCAGGQCVPGSLNNQQRADFSPSTTKVEAEEL